jgi:hypothetical protein
VTGQRSENEQLQALRAAVLQGDKARAGCVVAGLALFGVIVSLRAALMPQFTAQQAIPALGFLGLVVAYEFAMLLGILRTLRLGRDLPRWLVLFNVIFESMIATAGIALVMAYQDGDRRLALSAPVVLLYFYFFAATSLRMAPVLNVIMAILATAGYAGAGLYAHLAYSHQPSEVWLVSPAVHLTCGALILAGGLLSAAVAGRIRRYVLTGIREAAVRERMQRELDIAQRLQQDLLPKETLAIPGYELAGWSNAASETGGDYYDWLMLPEGRAILTIADATGHGLGPALMVTVCRAYFRATTQAEDSIEQAVARVNDLIASDLPEGSFVTAAIAALDPAKDQLRLYSAGHGPILFYRAGDGQVLNWGADTLPLGLLVPMHTDPSRGIPMGAGDMLVLVTDGFFEWIDARDEQYGIERLERFVQEHCRLDPASFIQALYEDVLAFAGGTVQMDDLTAIVLKRAPRGKDS